MRARFVALLVVFVLAQSAPAQAVLVDHARAGGSGTAVSAAKGKTLVLSCNHVFADQPFPGAPFPRADYPVECTVTEKKTGKKFPAVAVDGATGTDSAWVVVDGELPVYPLAARDARQGDVVYHDGRTTGVNKGVVMMTSRPGYADPKDQFVSTNRAISGDSGAGFVSEAGELVGLLCGRTGLSETAPARGTPVRDLVAPVTAQRTWENYGLVDGLTITAGGGLIYGQVGGADRWFYFRFDADTKVTWDGVPVTALPDLVGRVYKDGNAGVRSYAHKPTYGRQTRIEFTSGPKVVRTVERVTPYAGSDLIDVQYRVGTSANQRGLQGADKITWNGKAVTTAEAAALFAGATSRVTFTFADGRADFTTHEGK